VPLQRLGALDLAWHAETSKTAIKPWLKNFKNISQTCFKGNA